MSNASSISDQRFGTLTAIRPVGSDGKRVFWECRCDCGKVIVAKRDSLHRRKSCGCLTMNIGERTATHNHSRGRRVSPEYRAWSEMKRRCLNKNHRKYQRYGGRGITIYPPWIKSFATFLADVGLRPSSEYTLDRIENNDGYWPGNVRWATRHAQGRNKSTNRVITVNGITACVADWAERSGIHPTRIIARLNRGWSPKDAVTKPLRVTSQTVVALARRSERDV